MSQGSLSPGLLANTVRVLVRQWLWQIVLVLRRFNDDSEFKMTRLMLLFSLNAYVALVRER